jgi:hypothetical protein
MKKISLLTFGLLLIILTSCEWVKPNYAGVFMENYGKNGKSDFSLVTGKVGTMAPGTELIQVPLWEQRGGYDSILHLKDADNTEFQVNPTYSYRVIKEKAIDVVFENNHLDGDGEEFLESIENNVLEMRIRDLIKEESRRYKTDTLMANSGSLKFEEKVQKIIKEAFAKSGFELISFSSQLEFQDKVKKKIEERNEVSQDLQVVEGKILVQVKKNELARLQAQENIELSKGLTDEILQKMAIEGWIKNGSPTPNSIGSNSAIYIPVLPKK